MYPYFILAYSVCISAIPRPNLMGLDTSLIQHGGVASDNALCSGIGIDMYRRGGNAADAMVATVLCNGVVGMHMNGIGGGGFMLIRSSNGSFTFVDFRETAPSAASQDMYSGGNFNLSKYGGLASGVPGELRGLEFLQKTHGKLDWQTVVQPSVSLARSGFPVTEDLVYYMDSVSIDGHDFLTSNKTWATDFAPNGTRLRPGDIMTRTRLADTLDTISKQGANAFYDGTIANSTISALKADGGIMTLEDLKNYSIIIRNPANIEYRGYKVFSTTAPSSGAIVLSILKTLEGYGPLYNPGEEKLTAHRLDEAMRFGYARRAKLGDPSFTIGTSDFETAILQEEIADQTRLQITDNMTHPLDYYDLEGFEVLDTPGTAHFVTADDSGVAVSLTSTINLLFGSQLMVPDTGIIMNDQMDDFSKPTSANFSAFGYHPSVANYIEAGKRPLSAISASIVTDNDGSLYFVVGAAGAARIVSATTQNLIWALDRNLSASDVLVKPRLHDQLVPNMTTFEWTYDNSTVDYLRQLGHITTWVPPLRSRAHCIRRLKDGTFEAAAEPRLKNSSGLTL